MGTTLVVNPGSASRKYAFFVDGIAVLEWEYEATNEGFESCLKTTNGTKTCSSVSESQYNAALSQVASDIETYLQQAGDTGELNAIALRVVAPGTFFQAHRRIDGAFIAKLEAATQSAPLHVPHILAELAACQKLFPRAVLLAVSDSAFHSTLPLQARNYSLQAADAEAGDIYRFGYHGLSVASVSRRLPEVLPAHGGRVIVCHIGGGVSVTALKDGQSVETTMSYAPASGLVMGSRAGDLDAAGLLALMRYKNLKVPDAEVYLNTQGGLRGLAKESDIRQLLDRYARQEETALQALDSFVYHLQKAIAASTVALGGVDTLVFTATAGVRSSEIRSLVCARLSYLGIEVQPNTNEAHCNTDGVISAADSAVQVAVLRTDEMGEMARIAAEIYAS